MSPKRCPCGTGLPYADCCGRLHDGTASAATAEQLMRSRYSAFVVGDPAYLLATWHERTRPRSLAGMPVRSGARRAPDERSEAGAQPSGARLLVAVRPGGQPCRSRFVRENGRWFYLDGVAG